MNARTCRFVLTLFALALGAGLADAAEEPETLAIGASAPDFALPGIDGKTHTLADYADAEILVLVFTANHCPTAQAYEERLLKLHADFAPRGVQLVLVSPNDPLALRLDEQGYSDLGDTLEDMRLRAEHLGFPFPYLYDGETQEMSRAYGPTATPHVFVFDRERRLRFVGRVDDNEDPSRVTTRDTRAALEALLAGEPVPAETTKVFGCSVKWADKRGWVERGYEEWAKEPVDLEPVDLDGVRAAVRNDSEKLRLVNVWATWCGPCLIEFPDLVSLHRIYRGRDFEVVTITVDRPELRGKAEAFLRKQQASMRNLAFDQGDQYALIEAVDPEWAGNLPHTVLVAPGGEILHRSSGAFEMLPLRRAIVDWLGRYYHSTPGGEAGAAR